VKTAIVEHWIGIHEIVSPDVPDGSDPDEAYSFECVEGMCSETRRCGVLRGSLLACQVGSPKGSRFARFAHGSIRPSHDSRSARFASAHVLLR
jgi:hypothetical protein